jgi:hypothetical protein
VDPFDDVELGETLGSLAVLLSTSDSVQHDLQRLAELTARLIPDCSGASISMLVEGAPTSVAMTDRFALQLDLVQYEHDDGPCITALGGEMIRIEFIAADERFPHFAQGAADQRVQSVLSVPAIDHGAVVGSLNIYSHRRDAFDGAAHDTGLVMAAEVAHALVRSDVMGAARTTRDALQERYDESTLVARAQGVLVALQDCSVAQAGVLLRNAADDNGERLIRTAERILDSVRDHSETSTGPGSQHD